MGFIIDLNDFAVRTPEQMIRVFYSLYSAEAVRAELWEVFRNLAINDEKGIRGPEAREAKTALLFDHLINLTEAVEKLRQGITDAKQCVVCGQTRAADDHPGA